MSVRSLRTRFLVGSVFWTLGLLGASHLIFVAFVQYLPNMFRIRHWTLFGLIALAFMIGGWSQVRRGLSPVNQLRSRLAAVRDGLRSRVEGEYPAEVQPLVDDLNALLDRQAAAVVRAQTRAGDLAHGLKTPLTLLAREAERLESTGQAELAQAMAQQVDRMRRQVDYQLAQARASASGPTLGARTGVREALDALARTVARLHEGRGVRIDVTAAAEHAVRVQREDLDEMLGNLLDNACKWAAASVAVTSCENGPDIVVQVDDDGPGLEASLRDAVLQRGVRADEAAPGSGLGLAIVRDLAELYGGTITLTDAPGGGLRAELRLPAAAT